MLIHVTVVSDNVPWQLWGAQLLSFPLQLHESRLSRVGHFSPFGEVVNYILL